MEERPASTEREPMSVAELDRRLRRWLERVTADLRVFGEVSGLRSVSSGHSYFTLKDETEDATIDCVLYRTAPARARRLLADGARVMLTGRISVYAPRGRMQFVADDAHPAGRGAILEALERLKETLAAEGLLSAERKRPLPADPRVIGVVTSSDGAAIHDIVTVAFRRGPIRVLLARAPVQGASAAQRIARAVAMLERVAEVDAIVVARGGGSAEDLMAFNDEQLVRRLAACRVPVVSAVGHEVDVTLTDLVADARAATPSQAAEMLVPDEAARRATLAQLRGRLVRALAHKTARARAELEQGRARLRAESRSFSERRQSVDEAVVRLVTTIERGMAARRGAQAALERRLAARHPRAVLAAARAEMSPLVVRLDSAVRAMLAAKRRALASDAAGLQAMSPLSVLSRGYAIATSAEGRAIRDAREVTAGDVVRVRVHDGAFEACVTDGSAGRGTDA